MSFNLTYDQLAPVAGTVRAGVVSYDGSKPEHRAILREALPRFLGPLGAVHGAAFPAQYIDAVMALVDAKEIEVDFLLAANEVGAKPKLIGMATGAPTFDVSWDSDNNLHIFPVKHGEDMCVDKEEARLFREHSRDLLHPNGVGAGSWFMRELIRRSMDDPDWIYDGRDNEHDPDNQPIIGVMDKYGSIRGTVKNSAMMQMAGLTQDMKRRWGVNGVVTEDLPAQGNGLGVSPNSFHTRWSSKDGKQQMAVVYTKIGSTFDGQPIVWTKIRSNSNLPEGEMLKEVLASLLAAGCTEIASPKRRWGVPREQLETANDLSHAFGGPVPVMHLHISNEPAIIKALLEMDVEYRVFGHEIMTSGLIIPKTVLNQETTFGRKVPDATQVAGIDPERDVNKAFFDFLSVPNKPNTALDMVFDCSYPTRPVTDNDNSVLGLNAA